MRRFVASSLAALMLTLGVPLAGSANGAAANVVGQVVDASGRGSESTRVELLLNGAAVGTTTTSMGGSFMFTGIVPGTYVVRVMVNGQPAGVQVSLKAGQSAPVVVVLPSMVTAAAQVQLASLLANLSTTLAGVAGATVVSEAVEASFEDEDEEDIIDAIEDGSIVQTLVQAIQSAGVTLTQAQVTTLTTTIGQIIASLPTGSNDELEDELDEALDQLATNPTTITVGNNPTPITISIPSNPVINNNPSTGSGAL
jgi:hypothetical protein